MREESRSAETSPLHRAMEHLCRQSHGEGTTIGRVFEELGECGFLLGLSLLTLPFMFPLPTMGMSAPVGVLAMATGVALVVHRRPRVLGFISRRRLSRDFVTRLASVTTKVADPVSRWVRPRLPFMFWPGMRHGIGLGLVSAGFVLSLPLPIPLSNSIPALAILLLSLGATFQDGATVLAGHGVGLGAWGYLYAVGDVTWAVISKIFGMA